MADKRVFTIEIDGVEKSYINTIKLLNVLNQIKDVHAKVTVETDNTTRATEQSTKAIKEKSKAIQGEDKDLKKLESTLEKKEKLDTELGRLQVEANQQLRERAKILGQQIQLDNASTGSIDEKRLMLATLGGAYRALSEEERNAEHIGQAMLKQIQELREEYNELERSLGNHAVNVGNYESATAGLAGTLGKLGKGIDNTTESTKGLLSFFQAGVGIALMFDEGNSKLEKGLSYLGKVMATVSAIQSANNILIQKGIVLTKMSTVVNGIQLLQEKAKGKAIALSTKNTIAATVAQAAFNIVAKANPYVLLAMALITVIGALAAFALGSNDAAEKQKEFNAVIEDSIGLKEQYVSTMKKLSDANINEMQRELDLMKAKGASEAQLAQKQRQIFEERLKYAKKNSANHAKEISEIEKNTEKVKEYSYKIEALNKGLLDGTYKNNEAFKKKKETLEQYLGIYTQYLNIGLQAQEEEKKAINDLDKFNADTVKKGVDLGKKNALALAEYRVLMAQKGSKEELIAQIAVANQKLANDLNNTEITKGERLKRTKETLLEIEKLEADYRKAQLADSIALIDARLSLVKKGSLEEFNLKIARLEEQKKIDLDSQILTDNEKLKIENKFLEDVKNLTDEFDSNSYKNEIEAKIASINSQLAIVEAGSEKEFELREELARETARLSIEEANNSIANEVLKAAKIKEINSNLQKELNEIVSKKEVSGVEATLQKETLEITKELEKRTVTKRAFEKKMLNISVKALEKEIEIRKKYGQDTTDLEIKLSEMRIEQAERENNEITDYFEELHANMQKIVDNIMTGVTAVFDGINSVLDSQLEDAKEKYDAISQKYDEVVEKREESDNKLKSLDEEYKNSRGGRSLIIQQQIADEMQANTQLVNQEKQLAKEKEKQEKEVAKKEKQQKKAQIMSDIVSGVANTALAITSALTVKPFPLGVVLAAVAGAMGAVQVGVMTKQLSKLEDGGLLNGKRHSQGGMRIEGTNIEVEGGEYVINRESTAKNIGLIRYINSQRKELTPDDINSHFSTGSAGYEPPFKKMFETGGQLPNIENTVTVDNGAIVEAIESIDLEPVVSVTDINTVQKGVVKVDDWTDL